MGSLILAGAAQGLGQGIVQNVEATRRQEERDLDKQHDLALQKMREAGMTRLQKDAQGFQKEMYSTERTDTVADRETDYQRETAAAAAEREFEILNREDEQEQELMIEAMKLWQKSTEGNTVKSNDGKWEMKVLTETITPDASQPWMTIEEDRFVVREPGSPLSLEGHGTVMLPTGQTPEQKEKALAVYNSGKYKKAEQDLISKAGTDADDSSDFLEAFGYLPIAYFRKLTKEARSNKGFQSFYKTFREPANVPTVQPRTTLDPMKDDTDVLAPGNSGLLSEAQLARN